MGNWDLVAVLGHISAENNYNIKNHKTVGKRISSPTKPDKARFFNFIRLEVIVLQR